MSGRDAGAREGRAVHLRRHLGAAGRRHQWASGEEVRRRSELAARGEARV